MKITRRSFLAASTLVEAFGSCGLNPALAGPRSRTRSFHLCTNTDALKKYPDFLDLIVRSGITDIWMPLFLNGYFPYKMEEIALWKKRFEQKGIPVQMANVPFGHPGNSLGGAPELDTTPADWPKGVDLDGKRYSGTSVHPYVTAQNVAAIRKVRETGSNKLFLDDDFRLARSPGQVGGCFCPEHRQAFLQKYGYQAKDWEQLKAEIRARTLSRLVGDWVDFSCDELTGSFRAQQEAAPEVELGIMVMYLGSEKAGIRLADYKGKLFRVGELMFEDRTFAPVKGKTNELFSALFHRRFAEPERAYSETTAWPQDKLSAANMAAKLHITTLADIRNTMMMSGLEPFPLSHWSTLAPAMKKAAAIHRQVAGHTPRGPFKHYWGERERRIGRDQPNSLFLAAGIPFEVTAEPAADGWTFLGEFDAADAASGQLRSPGTAWICAAEKYRASSALRLVPENLKELFSLKKEILPALKGIPYVEEDLPAVCAWYPSLKKVLLWNLSESAVSLTVRRDDRRRAVRLEALDAALVPV